MLGFDFCEADFEPNPYSNGSWAIPEATECLQRTDFRLIPALFLLLTAPVLIYRSRYGKDTRGPRHHLSRLVYFKLFFSFLILINGFVLGLSDLLSGAPFFFPVAFVISLLVSFGLSVLCQRRGVFSSGVLFSFHVVLAVFSLPEFRYRLEKLIYDGDSGPRFYFTVLFFPLVVIQSILLCFSDYNWSIPLDAKKSPELKTSFVNQQLFGWITALISKGHKSPLVQDDVYVVNDKDLCRNVAKDFIYYYNRDSRKRGPFGDEEYERIIPSDDRKSEKSVLLPILLAQKWDAIATLIVVFGHMTDFLVPVFLGKLIDFTGDLSQPSWIGLGWAICLFLTAETLSITVRAFYYRMHVFEMNISSTLTSVIYTKALRLSNEARRGRTVGEIVNLMSVDVDNFKEFMENSMYVLLTPPTIIVGVVMLYNVIGVATFVGFGILVLLIAPASYYISQLSGRYEDERMEIRDERVKMTNEILNGMKVVKMHAWEESLKLVVEKLRDKELGLMAKMAYMTAFLHGCYGCINLFVTGSAFAFYVLIDPVNNVLTPQVAFVALSLFKILYNPILELPFIFSGYIRFVVSNKRIKSFLAEDELEDYIEREITPEGIISVKNASFYWEKGARMTLRDVTVAVKSGELVAVVGEVGCGKSSLIAALLGEMTKESGSVHVAGSVAYVPQQAWIQNATLKNNVLFGKPLDEKYYEEVIEACALKPDLEMLAAGDMTEIGERGINLSGGQKQRVSLARAVYSQRDVFLLDDPLSAVDAHVGKHLFERVISSETGLLRGKTRILVTHGVHFLKHCDRVIVLKGIWLPEQGTYQELISARGAFAEFLEAFVTKAIERRRTTSAGTDAEEEEEINEVLAELGTLSPKVQSRLESQLSQISRTSGVVAEAPEEKKEEEQDEEDENKAELIEEESASTGQVSKEVYLGYFRAVGFKVGILFVLTNVVCGFFRFENNIWLANWSDRTALNESGADDVGTNLGVYIGLAAGEALFDCLMKVLFAMGTLQASKTLHDALLKNVLRLPMSFFDTTPLGRILNRFGKDIESTDDTLPEYLNETCFSLYETFLSLLLVIRGSFYAIPLIVVILVINKVVMTYFIRSSRQLRRLESITRSPIYSHFQESLQGAVSIRAYGCRDRFLEESQNRTDTNKAMFYYNTITQQWLVVRLEFLGALLTVMAALMAVFFRGTSGISAGIIGLAVSQSFNISQQLARTIRMISGLENNIVSVERVREYTHLPPESQDGEDPPRDWPERGAITIENLQLRYREGLDLVLRGIAAKIAPGEKIGIVGRTGAGKSSLTLALFRIVEADSGRILIDGRDISTLGLRELRSKLTIVPQDPVLFSGSFRMNLDPFGEFDDARLWEALRVASLRDFVESLPERLEHEVAEGGENLSVGQRQLVCLARAVLHRTRILVLDEAAAALDLETDALIQRTIREHFRQCTVLTIAHRLNTVVDNDRLLVLERGQVKEFDSPHNLLADRDSLFHSMAKEAGLV
ncbi:hypothetical protein QR680_008734 [Steinernema hermaphroditum]|uniref:ABC-type glutathione-S-conjugate transporter n=1 Tax=Steinernema hermaphroditum TaxID=289476 RepID=A0AA39IHQ8_9BILA|nr:hypothetical protein QR680_008734 [Steinernema hermaphroditum]